MRGAGPVRVRKTSPLFDAVQKMHATASLNPYEREVLYGYPYVIGRCDGQAARGPLLTLAVQITPEADGFVIHPADEVAHVNILPFKPQGDVAQHEQKVARVLAATPALPLENGELNHLCEVVTREFAYVERNGSELDGTLIAPPSEPRGGTDPGLWLIDQAAFFIAPKTSYFLAHDLRRIGSAADDVEHSALAPILGGPGPAAQVDLSDADIDNARLFFPFPSNRSQRRAALLVEDSTTRTIRVEGPPGTGKSLTIANLACHLAATGRTVLVTSQKDKALQVVDSKLRELGLAELPMTLLHRDNESKKDLLRRLERIKKERSEQEVTPAYEHTVSTFVADLKVLMAEAGEYERAITAEARFESAHRAFEASTGIRRVLQRARFWYTRRKVRRESPRATDEIASVASAMRGGLLSAAVSVLQLGRERAVAGATREERTRLRELAAVLKRDQRVFKNYSLFDRLKDQPDRAGMLLKLLPVWVMTPDDVARLFPCTPGLFDVVIVDEASQVDLPSITPIAYRGKKLVVFGDTKQMQPRRFAFMSSDVTRQAWHQHGMDALDRDRWLHPAEQSLLTLAAIRADEEALLDEHYRSLPPIIDFSNQRWYDGRLRIMTDERRKLFGSPDQPIMHLHHVEDGVITNGSQENDSEAMAVVEFLEQLVLNPDYADASIGIMCLFEEQVALVQDLIAERIPLEQWSAHQLVVINPDGFQGDERDVILYSLSYDAKVMPQAALSARMSDQAHVQGMLNVAFTRARDEVHVFHSAPLDEFTFAAGNESAVSEWLRHCATVQAIPRQRVPGSRIGQIDSKFEADVAGALRSRRLRVLHQYPACGFHIDLVVERDADGTRVAVECDGERYHLDEHGLLRVEDIERQAVLERAGWTVVRIPYRRWIENRDVQVLRIERALNDLARARSARARASHEDERAVDLSVARAASAAPAQTSDEQSTEKTAVVAPTMREQRVTIEQEKIVQALREGCSSEDAVFLRARDLLGKTRLTKKLRGDLQAAATDLAALKLLAREDGEYFLLPEGREAKLMIRPREPRFKRRRRYPYRHRY